jgi:hypothetical protein
MLEERISAVRSGSRAARIDAYRFVPHAGRAMKTVAIVMPSAKSPNPAAPSARAART